MLDSDQNETSISHEGTAPRRRRSASRPAGPPQAVVFDDGSAAVAAAQSAPKATKAREPKADADKPAKRATRAKAAPADGDEAAKPVRARRAKTDDDPVVNAIIELENSVEGGAEPARARRTRSRKAVDAGADAADAAEGASPEAEGGSDSEGDLSARRRRRRRGGRRRRRGGDESVDFDGNDEDDEDSEGGEPGETSESGDEDGSGSGEGTRRRRRRRRRGGDSASEGDDDGTEVVVRVREPRARRGSASSDEVTGIEGSTRLEAKRQRRREGRAAGRRRAPILSEAEFLARREAVDRQMLIRQADEFSQIAVIEDGILVEHYVDRASATSLIGNIYLGRVQNVLPSMEAAFIDIGRGRNAVLYAGEVAWDQFGAEGQERKVEKVFKSGQTILVQVTKDPVGAKGARLTSHISVPGRYVVYAPGGHLSGISRKLPENERNRLKDILGELIGEEASVIIRTAAEGASEEELIRDVNRLKAQWEVIEKKAKSSTTAQLLYGEPDLTVRIVRDLFTEDFARLVIDGNSSGNDAYDNVRSYVDHVAPHLAERVTRWDRAAEGDVFAKFRIDEQIAKALERKVFLPSGGSLIIDRTEAMTVIDVNTGKFTGTGGNLEATVTANNLEAAEEIVRQLRLRDIGGIIVIDFIDMVLPNNRDLLLRRLVECLSRDRTRHQVSEVTSLGLVQLTRKKIGTGLAEAFTEVCDCCGGRGYVRHDEPVDTQAQADGGERLAKRGRGGQS